MGNFLNSGVARQYYDDDCCEAVVDPISLLSVIGAIAALALFLRQIIRFSEIFGKLSVLWKVFLFMEIFPFFGIFYNFGRKGENISRKFNKKLSIPETNFLGKENLMVCS